MTPRSIPIAVPGLAWESGTSRTTSTANDTNQRCALRLTVADRMRADPVAILTASPPVSSWVRMAPSLGSVTVFPEQRITPAPNRNESRPFPFFFRFGKPSFFPFRWPFLDLTKSDSARSRFRNAS